MPKILRRGLDEVLVSSSQTPLMTYSHPVGPPLVFRTLVGRCRLLRAMSVTDGYQCCRSVGRPKMFAASILWPRLLMQIQFDLQRVLLDPWMMLSRPPCLHGFATEPPDPLDKGRG